MSAMMTQVTTPDGHKVRLRVYYGDTSSTVNVQYGTLSIDRESPRAGDVTLIADALTAMDDLILNLADFKPELKEETW